MRNKFFYFPLILVILVLGMTMLNSCSNDDEGIVLTKSDVVGNWEVYEAVEKGETIQIYPGFITINLKSDNSYRVKFFSNNYVGKYKIDKNRVIGTTLDPITEYFTFKELDGNWAKIDYSNSEGTKYIFQAKKK